MKKYIFEVIIEPDEDKWHAFCPLLEEKGASTWGNTVEEALSNIKEVIIITLQNMAQHNEKIPSLKKIRTKTQTDLKIGTLYSRVGVPTQLSGQC